MVARPMVVMQILPDLESGGVERGTLEMGAFLSGEGHRSLVVSAGGRMVPRLVREGTRHVRLPVGEKGPRLFRAFSPLRDLILEEKADILHLRSRVPAWLALAVIRTLPPWKRPRVVTTFHGFFSSRHYSSVMARGERVIAISRFIADHIRKTYRLTGDRIRVIHRGCDAAVFDPALVSPDRVESMKRRWGLPPAPGPVILLPGRITRWKGHAHFLDALAGIRDLPWTAVLAGDPAENPDFAALLKFKAVRLGLEGRVILPGLCEDMPAAFLAADLAVSASTRPEAFGRVAVEAQAMGLPVAATAHGGSLETVVHGRTGWLFPPGDVRAFSRALAQALSEGEKRQEMGRNAREWVVARFTSRVMCEKTLKVYEELLERP